VQGAGWHGAAQRGECRLDEAGKLVRGCADGGTWSRTRGRYAGGHGQDIGVLVANQAVAGVVVAGSRSVDALPPRPGIADAELFGRVFR
jgi:hypothetical protein